MKRLLLLPIVLGIISAGACTYDKVEVPKPKTAAVICDSVQFARDITPILDAKCNTCHTGYFCGDFTTYSGVKNVVDNGLFQHRVLVERTMPPVEQLNEEEMQKLRCWIDAGAPQN